MDVAATDTGRDGGAGVWSTTGPNLSLLALPTVSSSSSSTSDTASKGSINTIVDASPGLLNDLRGT